MTTVELVKDLLLIDDEAILAIDIPIQSGQGLCRSQELARTDDHVVRLGETADQIGDAVKLYLCRGIELGVLEDVDRDSCSTSGHEMIVLQRNDRDICHAVHLINGGSRVVSR